MVQGEVSIRSFVLRHLPTTNSGLGIHRKKMELKILPRRVRAPKGMEKFQSFLLQKLKLLGGIRLHRDLVMNYPVQFQILHMVLQVLIHPIMVNILLQDTNILQVLSRVI